MLFVPLLIGDTGAIFAALGNISLARLVFIESERGFERKLASNFTSFGGILSAPLAFLVSMILEVDCDSMICDWFQN